jgi:hypothetical protein
MQNFSLSSICITPELFPLYPRPQSSLPSDNTIAAKFFISGGLELFKICNRLHDQYSLFLDNAFYRQNTSFHFLSTSQLFISNSKNPFPDLYVSISYNSMSCQTQRSRFARPAGGPSNAKIADSVFRTDSGRAKFPEASRPVRDVGTQHDPRNFLRTSYAGNTPGGINYGYSKNILEQ